MNREWRNCKAWADEGLALSTTNDEAARMYDASVTQLVGWYDDKDLGGLDATMKKTIEADPNFVMGHVIRNAVELMEGGKDPHQSAEVKKKMDLMDKAAESPNTTSSEKLHIEAVKLLANGYLKDAVNKWEEILLADPCDILALRLAHDGHFFMGDSEQMRDSVYRVIPLWNPKQPNVGYMLGMLAFGLGETQMFEEGEKHARKALKKNPRDAWSTHALANIMQMQGRENEGIDFMTSNVKDWTFCEPLACHIYWHWFLYLMEQGEFTEALDLYDTAIGARAIKTGKRRDITDASSALYRLFMEGVNVGKRWAELYNVVGPHVYTHHYMIADIHILMVLLNSGKKEEAHKMLESLKTYSKEGDGWNCEVTRRIGVPLSEALIAYHEKEYAKAVDLIHPIRYRIVFVGGSNAQKDIFSQFLIHATMKSPRTSDKNITRALMFERKALKPKCSLTDRLMAKAMLDADHWDFSTLLSEDHGNAN